MTLDSSTVLGAPGGTAPTFPTQGQDPSQQPDAVRALIAHILQSANQGSRQMAAPVASPLPQQTPHPNPTPEGAYQKDWGFQRFAANVQNSIQQGVANHKAAQLAHAESQWNQLTVLMQDQSPAGQQKLNNWLIANQKSLKGMAKALNQDWLNPEKTDVWKEALKNVATQQQQKGQAASGMREMFKHLIGKATQPQLSQDQQQKMASEIAGKAPISTAGDPKQLNEAAQAISEIEKAQADLTRAQTEAREKYQFITGADGSVTAVDKADPHKVVPLTDESGKPITGQVKVGLTPKVVSVGGVPYGVTRGGKVVTPGDPDWTGQDAKLFQAASGAKAAADAGIEHRMKVSAAARAQAYKATREYGVIDTETGGLVMAGPDMINASPGRYAPASQAIQVKNRSALFDEIDYTTGQVNQAIASLPDTGFDAKARAQVSAVLRDADPRSALQTFLGSSAAETLTDPQIQYVTGLVSLNESAMSLRSLGGMGSGSDQLRSAITRMLPGPETPSKKYAQRQMELFQGEVGQLRKSLPRLGTGTPKADTKSAGPPAGAVSIGTSKKDGKDHYLDAQGKDLGTVN